MGLIARALEEAGIATVSLTSAYSITDSVGVPRGVFLDYPLGQTAGRAGEPAEQRQIMEFACQAFEDMESPGEIKPAPLTWPEGASWKDAVMRPHKSSSTDNGSDDNALEHRSLRGDQRTHRHDTPQYQLPEDLTEAEPNCPSCVFLTTSGAD